MVYTFPFSTCEVPSPGSIISQPWSFGINLMSALVLLILAVRYNNMAIYSYFLFELFHAFSHAVHLPGKTQHMIAHLLGYLIAFCTWMQLHRATKKKLPPILLLILGLIVSIDIYVLLFVGGVWTIFFGLLILTVLFSAYLSHIPSKRLLMFLILGVVVLLLLFFNESVHCEMMLKRVRLPYHALIEVLGFFLFIGLAMLMLQFE